MERVMKTNYICVHKLYRRTDTGETFEAAFDVVTYSPRRIRMAYTFILRISDECFNRQYRIAENVLLCQKEAI
jgi:hypothetical protein